MREFPVNMIFNIVYHPMGTSMTEDNKSVDQGLSIEVQMAWGGSSTYTFLVRKKCIGYGIVHFCGVTTRCISKPLMP